jgi:hypothetical protein
MSEGVTTRKCSNCEEWYDARASSCYFCDAEERETNSALKKAVETTRLNSALAQQMSGVNREAAAERMLASAKSDKTGAAYARARPPLPGYGDLVEGLKDSLEEHPDVLRYMTGRD